MKYRCDNCGTEIKPGIGGMRWDKGYASCWLCKAKGTVNQIPDNGKDIPDALKFTDTEIPIESVKFKPLPDNGKTLDVEWYKKGLEDGLKEAIKYLESKYLAACGGGK